MANKKKAKVQLLDTVGGVFVISMLGSLLANIVFYWIQKDRQGEL